MRGSIWRVVRILFSGLLVFMVLATVYTSPVQAETGRRQVILVECDYLQLSDLEAAKYPHLYSFFRGGQVALLNTNTAGSHNRPNAAATVGAGRVAMGTPKETVVAGSTEPGIDQPLTAYQARTGFSPLKGNLVVLDLPSILRANATGNNRAIPGTLGSSLHQAGFATAALGNADLPGLPQRSGAVIAMDGKGVIDYGDVSVDLVEENNSFPTVYRTNYQALEKKFLSIKDKAQFITIDLGDLVRLEQSKPTLTDRVYHNERQRIIAGYDHFIGWLLENSDRGKSRIIAASLVPTPDDLAQNRSLGLIAVQGDGNESGLLASPTTRRPGIITLYDLAPSMAGFLGAPIDKNWLGRAWEFVPDSNNLATLQTMTNHIFFTSMMRPPMIEGYVAVYLVILGILIVFLCWRPKYGNYLTPFLLGLLAVPLIWLLIGNLPVYSPYVYTLIFLIVVVLVTLFSMAVARNDLDSILFLCMTTVAVLLIDSVTGWHLQKSALLGYDPMDGARFYGIGNEYMGVLLGAIVMGSALFLQRIRRHPRLAMVLIGLLFLTTIVILAAPQWGSKFGGVLTTLVAFIYTFARFNGIKINWRNILIAAVAVVLIAGGVLVHDFMRPPELRSHFGLLITSIQTRGFTAFEEIISRKLSMNYRLIKYTIWTRVYLGSLLALGFLFFRPVGIFGKVLKRYPMVARGLEGSLVGALVALLVNDSGIVAASTAIIFPAATLFYLVMEERKGETENSTLG